MTDTDRELSLQEEDRLPWLEAVDHDDDEERGTGSRMLGFVLLALAALGLLVGGSWWLRTHKQGPQGDGTLIAAKEGDYKVKPNDPGGMKVEGQGDSTFAASQGAEANGKVDPNAKTEAPVALAKHGATPDAKPVAAGKTSVSAPVGAAAGKLAVSALPTAGGGVVQLGAYGSHALAEHAWATASAGTPTLAKLAHAIESAQVGGRTVYRLRANAGTAAAASTLCHSIGNCMVVR
jgi:hypothetical protein